MIEMTRRDFLKTSAVLPFVVALPCIPVLTGTFETSGPEEVASLRLVSDFQICGYSNGGGPTAVDRDFEIGQILTKEDVDTTPGWPYDPEQPGWFEMLLEQDLAVPA